jgi:hypothetical protein
MDIAADGVDHIQDMDSVEVMLAVGTSEAASRQPVPAMVADSMAMVADSMAVAADSTAVAADSMAAVATVVVDTANRLI